MSRTGDLLLLQDLDARQARDQARLSALQVAISGDAELDRLRRQGRRSQRERVALDAETNTQEAVVDALRRRARELDRHLYDGSVGNPQELIGMQHELDILRGRVTVEEERQLEMMGRAEAAAAREQEAASLVVVRTAERAAGAAGVTADAADRRAALGRLAEEREALVAGLVPVDLALYERLRGRVRPAVVRLTADSCGGCHIPFGNSEVRRVRAGEAPVQCSNCDRIVVS